jgi:hypothetical protein
MSNIGTADGDMEERQFVKDFNAGLFQEFCLEHYPDNHHVYAVRVTSSQFSKVTQQDVKTKADAFLVTSKVDLGETLRSKGFLLEEEDLQELEYEVLFGSGISIKSPNSTSYQYHKFTVDSFVRTFDDRFIGAGASMYVRSKDFLHNPLIMGLWGVDEQSFVAEFSTKLNMSSESIGQSYQLIQEWCLKEIRERILNEEKIWDAVFCGKTIFESPYFVSYSYFHGQLGTKLHDEFYVTQGSGRKTNPTIVIKPR